MANARCILISVALTTLAIQVSSKTLKLTYKQALHFSISKFIGITKRKSKILHFKVNGNWLSAYRHVGNSISHADQDSWNTNKGPKQNVGFSDRTKSGSVWASISDAAQSVADSLDDQEIWKGINGAIGNVGNNGWIKDPLVELSQRVIAPSREGIQCLEEAGSDAEAILACGERFQGQVLPEGGSDTFKKYFFPQCKMV